MPSMTFLEGMGGLPFPGFFSSRSIGAISDHMWPGMRLIVLSCYGIFFID